MHQLSQMKDNITFSWKTFALFAIVEASLTDYMEAGILRSNICGRSTSGSRITYSY